ncbi:hypothetical protein D9M72_399750 [compost metagenome]
MQRPGGVQRAFGVVAVCHRNPEHDGQPGADLIGNVAAAGARQGAGLVAPAGQRLVQLLGFQRAGGALLQAGHQYHGVAQLRLGCQRGRRRGSGCDGLRSGRLPGAVVTAQAACCRLAPRAQDGLVERIGLGLGRHAEFALQRRPAQTVLLECQGLPALPLVQPDQGPVHAFLQRIERKQARGTGDGKVG